MIDDWGISGEIGLRLLSLDLNDDKSTLIQVMAWCHQATSHYLSQGWPRSMPPYGITRPQSVNCHYLYTIKFLKSSPIIMLYKQPYYGTTKLEPYHRYQLTGLRIKWLPLCRQHFQMHFLEAKCLYFDSIFIEVHWTQTQTSDTSCGGLWFF